MWRYPEHFPFFYGWWGGGLGNLVFWALVVCLGVYLFRRLTPRPPGKTARADREDALDILKTRLARGQISLDEYETLRRAIE